MLVSYKYLFNIDLITKEINIVFQRVRNSGKDVKIMNMYR